MSRYPIHPDELALGLNRRRPCLLVRILQALRPRNRR